MFSQMPPNSDSVIQLQSSPNPNSKYHSQLFHRLTAGPSVSKLSPFSQEVKTGSLFHSKNRGYYQALIKYLKMLRGTKVLPRRSHLLHSRAPKFQGIQKKIIPHNKGTDTITRDAKTQLYSHVFSAPKDPWNARSEAFWGSMGRGTGRTGGQRFYLIFTEDQVLCIGVYILWS